MENPYEILFVTHKYPPSIGGMQKQSYELIKHISEFTKVKKLVYSNRYPVFIFLVSSFIRVLTILRFNKEIKIVHANDGLMALFLTPLIWLTNRKLAATVHGLDIVYDFKPFQWWVRKFLSKFDLIIAVSNATLNECIKRGFDESKVVMIPNAFDLPPKFSKSNELREIESELKTEFNGKKILLAVGRAIPRKGFLWFVLNVLPKIHHEVILIIVGPHLKHPQVTKLIQRILPKQIFNLYCSFVGITLDILNLEEILIKNPKANFRIVGKLSDTELDQLYRHADIFVMPNLPVKGDFEGFGLVALEAVSRGTVCLASNIDGIPSAIQDGKNGYLIETGNDTVWASKINELLSQNLNEIGDHFKHNLLNDGYDWNKMALKYLKIFNRL